MVVVAPGATPPAATATGAASAGSTDVAFTDAPHIGCTPTGTNADPAEGPGLGSCTLTPPDVARRGDLTATVRNGAVVARCLPVNDPEAVVVRTSLSGPPPRRGVGVCVCEYAAAGGGAALTALCEASAALEADITRLDAYAAAVAEEYNLPSDAEATVAVEFAGETAMISFVSPIESVDEEIDGMEQAQLTLDVPAPSPPLADLQLTLSVMEVEQPAPGPGGTAPLATQPARVAPAFPEAVRGRRRQAAPRERSGRSARRSRWSKRPGRSGRRDGGG